ncbi:TAF1 transcription initiation factor TFIID subunit TAF1 [Hysterangium stoloniferum]|nr:TAF1 transcription initiation factor TFIID subunit TAF1 [Hysterangium stoloniferum]
MSQNKDENQALSSLTGFGLDHVLKGLNLPSTSSLGGQLGSGLGGFSWEQNIYSGQGDDWEDEVDAEVRREEDIREEDGPAVKLEEANLEVSQPTRRTRIVKKLIERPKTVYERFPTFEKDKILDFSELFKGFAVKKSRITKKPFNVEIVLPKTKRVPRGYLGEVVGDTKREVETQRVAEVVASSTVEDDLRRALLERGALGRTPVNLPLSERSFDLVLLSDWEEQIIYDVETRTQDIDMTNGSATPAATSDPISNKKAEELMTPANEPLESGIWTQSIIWDSKTPFRDFTQLEIPDEPPPEPETTQVAEALRPKKRLRTDIGPRDKFNLSNDQQYEVSKETARQRVRQTFQDLHIQHSYPAQKLQLPFYKTRLTKQEARSFHRPALQFPCNIELRFSKVRTAMKKKDKQGRTIVRGGDVGEALRKTSDLTLKDTSSYMLFEFSEEHPPIMSSFGMGSMVVNYYRKRDQQDEHIPKYDVGEPFLIEPDDQSPFQKFGFVHKGQVVQALYNNLIRAPIFRQKAYPTDFLVIRNTVKGEPKYYIREIKTLFVTGQTYPVHEVPGPHSRKITTTLKHRLQIIAFKLLRKSQGERLKISRLMKYFPDQNELQMRQRLKEFMEYHRRGPHQGFWRLKANWSIPSDAEMLKMVEPEAVVLSESMQVGQRHLQDSGYAGAEAGDEGEESKLTIEQRLAPWITTKNFLLATQGKAMLQLHGEGDPTGRGEAFSCIRISMKEIFVGADEDYEAKLAEAENRPKSQHRYNVQEQQTKYNQEIVRIWNNQWNSLIRKTEPELTDDEEEKRPVKKARFSTDGRDESPSLANSSPPPIIATPSSSAATPVPSNATLPGADVDMSAASPAFSRGSSVDRDLSIGPENAQKVLKIRRLVDGIWKTEIVRDSAVISAYVRKRQQIEEELVAEDALAPTGDTDRDARAKKKLEERILKLKKNQERRVNRKNAKAVKEGGVTLQLKRMIKTETTRRCGHCGQMGHMKTNRNCPKWAEFNTPQPVGGVAVPSPGVTSPPAHAPYLSTPDGLFSSAYRSTSSYGFPAAVPSPLATSPPVSAAAFDGFDNESQPPQPLTATPSGPPKIKLKLGKKM